MKTVQETPTFKKQADAIWTEEQCLEFVSYIAENPEAGDVIPNAEGARKIRWSVAGGGKRGGVRVIYFNVDDELLCLIAIYKKADKSNMSSKQIKEVR